jgi:hypothetical protein
VCTLIAIAVLPLMKRLSATHSSQSIPAAGAGIPSVASEE